MAWGQKEALQPAMCDGVHFQNEQDLSFWNDRTLCKTKKVRFDSWIGCFEQTRFAHGPLARFGKLQVTHAPGIPEAFFPPPRVSVSWRNMPIRCHFDN